MSNLSESLVKIVSADFARLMEAHSAGIPMHDGMEREDLEISDALISRAIGLRTQILAHPEMLTEGLHRIGAILARAVPREN